MSSVEINLTQDARTLINIDLSTSGTVYWTIPQTMDSGYTLTLDKGLATEQVYTVGSGLTLDAPNKTITWAFGSELDQAKDYVGELVSDSRVIGVYFSMKVVARIRVRKALI